MEEHQASMQAYKKVHNETMRSKLRMASVQQSMEMDMWEIKEKLAERRVQMAIRAYEEDKKREEWIQKIEEDKMREEWIQKIEEDKRRGEWNQKIEEMINLIQSFIQNLISFVKTSQQVTTKKEKEKERKGPFVWTKSKSRVVIEVGQTEAIKGGLNCANHLPSDIVLPIERERKGKGLSCVRNQSLVLSLRFGQTEAIEDGLYCDNRLANYEQPCQHFLMFDYDPQEGELQVKTWDPGIT
ncbi:hypothetical protein Tco_1117275 [Tanacetum coccineum]